MLVYSFEYASTDSNDLTATFVVFLLIFQLIVFRCILSVKKESCLYKLFAKFIKRLMLSPTMGLIVFKIVRLIRWNTAIQSQQLNEVVLL